MSLQGRASDLVWRVWPGPSPLLSCYCPAKTGGGSFGWGGASAGQVFRVTDCPCKWQTTCPRNLQPGNQLMCVFSSLKPQHLWQGLRDTCPCLGSAGCWTGLCACGQGPPCTPGPRGPPHPGAALGIGEAGRGRESLHALVPTQLACEPRSCLVPVPLCLGVWCSLSFLQIEPVFLQTTVCSAIWAAWGRLQVGSRLWRG